MTDAAPDPVRGQIKNEAKWPLHVHRPTVSIDGAYRDPDTGYALKIWEDALAGLDDNPDARSADVMRRGSQVDVKGILAGSKDADGTTVKPTTYLAESMSEWAPSGSNRRPTD